MPIVKLFFEKARWYRTAGGDRLVDDAEKRLGSIDPLFGAAWAVKERVADSVSTAHHRLGVDTVR
jgi:hypothetical protein